MSLVPLVLIACLPLTAQEWTGSGAPQSDRWTGSVGAMALTYPSAPGSASNRTVLLPTASAQYGKFYLGSSRVAVGFGGGIQLWRTPAWTWELGLGVGDGRPESRAPELAGMGDRNRSVWAGTGIQWRSRGWSARANLAHGLSDDGGNRATAGVGRTFPLAPGWSLTAGLHASWSDADNLAYDFGISPEQAQRRSALVAAGDTRLKPGETGPFAPGAGLRDVGGILMLAYRSGPRLTWHGMLFGGTFQGDARRSPLARRDSFLNAGLGFSYRLGD